MAPVVITCSYTNCGKTFDPDCNCIWFPAEFEVLFALSCESVPLMTPLLHEFGITLDGNNSVSISNSSSFCPEHFLVLRTLLTVYIRTTLLQVIFNTENYIKRIAQFLNSERSTAIQDTLDKYESRIYNTKENITNFKDNILKVVSVIYPSFAAYIGGIQDQLESTPSSNCFALCGVTVHSDMQHTSAVIAEFAPTRWKILHKVLDSMFSTTLYGANESGRVIYLNDAYNCYSPETIRSGRLRFNRWIRCLFESFIIGISVYSSNQKVLNVVYHP